MRYYKYSVTGDGIYNVPGCRAGGYGAIFNYDPIAAFRQLHIDVYSPAQLATKPCDDGIRDLHR